MRKRPGRPIGHDAARGVSTSRAPTPTSSGTAAGCTTCSRGGRSWRAIPKFLSWCVSGNVIATLKWMTNESHETTIHDARVLEAQEGLSKAGFFHKFGFVLLDHASRMTASDWLDSGEAFLVDETEKGAEEQARYNMTVDTPAKRIYGAEVRSAAAGTLSGRARVLPAGTRCPPGTRRLQPVRRDGPRGLPHRVRTGGQDESLVGPQTPERNLPRERRLGVLPGELLASRPADERPGPGEPALHRRSPDFP